MATIRSWTQIWPSFLRLCILNLVLDFKIIALGDDNGSSGFATTAENTCKNTNYQGFLPPPYQNISHMICTPVWHSYELRYIQNGDTTTIILSAPYTIGWVGIGFSRDGMMVGSSAMVGWISKHGHAKIKQFYLRGRKQSEVIVDKGELPLSNVPAAVATNGAEIHMAFQLQMTTPFQKQPILLAFGSKYPQNHHLSKHQDEAAIVFDFSSGPKSFLCDSNCSSADMTYNLLQIVTSVSNSKIQASFLRNRIVFSSFLAKFRFSEPHAAIEYINLNNQVSTQN